MTLLGFLKNPNLEDKIFLNYNVIVRFKLNSKASSVFSESGTKDFLNKGTYLILMVYTSLLAFSHFFSLLLDPQSEIGHGCFFHHPNFDS